MTTEGRTSKNKRISETKRATVSRHLEMDCKTFDVKVQENSLNKQQKEALERIFLEPKLYKNFIINWSNQSGQNKLSKFDTRQTSITKKDKDMNDIDVHIQYLSDQSRQCLLLRMLANAKTIKTLSTKGLQKGGHLRFSKEETTIDLKQYGVSHRIVSSKRIKIAGIKKALVVNGLKQFTSIQGIEYANARLLKRPSGYYNFLDNKITIMDSRLERIRLYKGNVMDFTSYINDRIKETKDESNDDRKKSLKRKIQKMNESAYQYTMNNFSETDNIPLNCIAYILDNVDDFNSRYGKALGQIEKRRSSLRNADYYLFEDIMNAAIEWYENDGSSYDEDDIISDIEEIFG